MRLQDIKTENDFYQVADNWYNRTKNLGYIFMDEKETKERAEKAYRLWSIMFQRMQVIIKISSTFNNSYIYNDFKSGGVNL